MESNSSNLLLPEIIPLEVHEDELINLLQSEIRRTLCRQSFSSFFLSP